MQSRNTMFVYLRARCLLTVLVSVNGELCSKKKPSAITFVGDDKKFCIKVSSVTESTVWCYLRGQHSTASRYKEREGSKIAQIEVLHNLNTQHTR